MKPYYEDDYVTLYHADVLEHLEVLDQADVMVTDPPYGSQGIAKGYGRRGKTIANDLNTDARDAVLDSWGGASGCNVRNTTPPGASGRLGEPSRVGQAGTWT